MSEISQYTESLHEECGVFGMYDKTGETDMVSAVYSALYALPVSYTHLTLPTILLV